MRISSEKREKLLKKEKKGGVWLRFHLYKRVKLKCRLIRFEYVGTFVARMDYVRQMLSRINSGGGVMEKWRVYRGDSPARKYRGV